MAFIAPLIGLPASLGTAMGLGAGMLGAVGSLMQGAATQTAMQYNANVAKVQAKVAGDQAASQYANTVDQTRQKIASSIAAGGGSGISETSGSFRDYLIATGEHGYLAGLNQIYAGKVASTGYLNQATADIFAGKQAMLAGEIGAGTKMLSSVAQAYRYPGTTFDYGWNTSVQ